MKKFILSTTLLLTTMLSTCALADEPVCSSSERRWVTDSRFFDTGISSSDGNIVAHFLDLETIKIDKKNKIIKVWIIREVSEKGRSAYTQKIDGFSNFGYERTLWTIDYANMRLNIETTYATNCDGSTIMIISGDGKWDNISPSSINEAVVKKIMQKYTLE